MHHHRRLAVLALTAVTALVPSAGALAQSPPADPAASSAPSPIACPSMTQAVAPIHDAGAVLSLAFGAPNPDPAVGGFHSGDDRAGPDGAARLPVFAIGDGTILAVQPGATDVRHGGLVVVQHTGPFAVPASTPGAPYAYAASTEDAILSVYAGVDPAPDLLPGACVDDTTQLGVVTAACGPDVPDPCSDGPAALHLEIRLASTADPARRSADWSVAGPEADATDGWFHDAQRMVDDGLREPSAFLASLPAEEPLAGIEQLVGSDGRLTVLILGSDRLNPACKDRGESLLGERTDTIMFATINPANGKVAMASLPRDTIGVPIGPGSVYGPKITALFESLVLRNRGNRTKALRQMVNAMEYLTGVQIDHYALTYFCGVRNIVDAVGGIDITLDAPLSDPTMHIGKHGLKLKAGKHHLDGGRALVFARTRHSDSDYARARRQQQVIIAALDGARENGLDVLPALVALASDKVTKKLRMYQTDVPIDQAGTLFALLQRARLSSFKGTVLSPPTYATEGTGDLLYSNLPNLAQIRSYFARVFGPVNP